MNSSPSQLNMHYGACPKKLEARFQTIIKSYRDHYKIQSIPKNTQYWSICGRCSYEMGKMEENCEPDQLIKSKLIQPNQFYGIEINPDIYQFNMASNNKIHWFLGDFYDQMVEYSNHNNFNPSIVNADMLLMPKYGAEYFSRIMHFLTTSTKKVMLVGNFIAEHRHFRFGIKDIVSGLQKESCFQFSMYNGDWKFNSEYYWYNGTGKTTTKMLTLIIHKK